MIMISNKEIVLINFIILSCPSSDAPSTWKTSKSGGLVNAVIYESNIVELMKTEAKVIISFAIEKVSG